MTTSTSQNNYTKNNNHNHNDHTSNNKQNHRISIRQKTSYNNTPSSWKEKLKQQCLQRARDKRKHTLQIKRQYPQYNTTTNTITNIRNPYNNNHNEIMRNVINEQLKQNDIKVINNNNSSNTTTTTNNNNNNNNNISYITEEELYQLMIEIENELQLEQENILQEEIINVKEIQEEQDLCYIQEQIEMYQSSSSGNDTLSSVMEMDDIDNDGNNDDNNNVPCPLCHHGNLIQDDYHNVIYCQYYQQQQEQHQQQQQQRQCKVCIHRTNTKGLSLVTLKDKLCQVYQEHSDSGCIGMIQFDMIEIGDNDTSLVVGCLRCGARAIVV